MTNPKNDSAAKPTDDRRIAMLTGALEDAAVALRLAEGGLMALGGESVLLGNVRQTLMHVEDRITSYGKG